MLSKVRVSRVLMSIKLPRAEHARTVAECGSGRWPVFVRHTNTGNPTWDFEDWATDPAMPLDPVNPPPAWPLFRPLDPVVLNQTEMEILVRSG